MKRLLLSIAILVLSIISCTNETNKHTANPTTDSITTAPTVSQPDSPKPRPTSPYVPLNETTYIGRVALAQETTFLNLVSRKQEAFRTENNDQTQRSDTLYTVSYLPFKDQELYLYQSAFTQTDSKLSNWCFSIIKNGEILVNEHIIAQGKFIKIVPQKMEVGAPALEFIGTTIDGTEETITLPYDGKQIQ